MATSVVDNDTSHPRLLAARGANVEGHQHIIDQFMDRGARRHHGYIFHGPKGVGKATTAYRLAECLFAQDMSGAGLFDDAPPNDSPNDSPDAPPNASPNAPSGVPSDEDAEVRLLRVGVHPDVMVVTSDPEKASGGISVDQIRKIVPFLAHTPSRGDAAGGGMRLVLIDAMDDMNVNGANALLKTLEEPPKNTILIIISHGTKSILPTIRSRTQLVKFAPLDFAATQSVIRAQFPDAEQNWVDAAAVLADGAPGVAAMLAEAGAPDLYADTCTKFADGTLSGLALDAISSQWGAGGVKNAARRHLARQLFDRMLVKAARHAVHASGGDVAHSAYQAAYQGPQLDIEEAAIARIAAQHSTQTITDIRQKLLSELHEAERLNLDVAPVIFNALNALNTA